MTTQLTIQVTHVISGTILGVDMVHGEAKGVGCWRRREENAFSLRNVKGFFPGKLSDEGASRATAGLCWGRLLDMPQGLMRAGQFIHSLNRRY